MALQEKFGIFMEPLYVSCSINFNKAYDLLRREVMCSIDTEFDMQKNMAQVSSVRS
jgi:hypothetical protein